MVNDITITPRHLIHQYLYLISKEDTDNMSPIASYFRWMCQGDFNILFWECNKKYTTYDKKKNTIHLKKGVKPDKDLAMTKAVRDLQAKILYAIKHYAETEEDLESPYIDELYFLSYPKSDVMVAVQDLKDKKLIINYTLTNPVSKEEYEFYTLTENFGKDWGEKYFRVDK